MSLMVSVSGVRGIVGPELNPLVIGDWIAAVSQILPPGPVVVGRDSRPSGEVLSLAVSSVFRALGREVLEVGIVPTPTVQLAVESWSAAGGIILSASHNPPAWNALKFVDTDGSFLSPERFAALKQAYEARERGFVGAASFATGRDCHESALDLHESVVLKMVDVERIRAARISVVLETGHGAGGTLLPRLAAKLGLSLDGRHLEPNGQLPANPEPTAETLSALLPSVAAGTTMLLMVDPDADRLGMALPGTDVVGEEWTLPLVVRNRLTQAVGPVVTNLSTSTRVEEAARPVGAEVIRTPVGEAHVVSEMKARGALIGGEGNGGVIDPRAHLGRDSAVGLALLAEAEAAHPGGLRALAASFPPRFMVKEKIALTDNKLGDLEARFAALLGAPGDRRDGLRWAIDGGFVHLRASNTEPILRVVVETASAKESEDRIQALRQQLGGR